MTTRVDVLLVEDDACLARAMLRQLHARGIGVEHCSTVGEAQQRCRKFRVGVFDIELPDGDGVKLARRLLADKVVTRAVFNTGCGDSGRLAEARSLGMVFGKSETQPLVSNLLSPSVASCAVRSKAPTNDASPLLGLTGTGPEPY